MEKKVRSVVWLAVPTGTPTGSIGTSKEVEEEWGAKIVSVVREVVLLMLMLFTLRQRNTLGVGA